MFDNLDIAAMADTVGLEVKSSSGYTRAGGDPFGTNQAAIDAVFDARVLTDGEVSDIIEIDANRSVVIKVAEHHEASLKPMDEVHDQIAGALKSAQAQELIAELSEELQAMLKRGDSIDEAAVSIGAVVSPTAVVSRSDEGLDARLLAAIFRSKKPVDGIPKIGGTFTQTEDYAVFSLEAVAPGRPESISLADRDARKNELATQSGTADFTAFLSELQQRAVIVRNDDIMQGEDTY